MSRQRTGNVVPDIQILESASVNGSFAKKVVPLDTWGNIADDLTPLRVDEADGETTYIGYAALGSSETALVWRVMKVTSSGATTTIAYPNASTDFVSRWSERTTLTYS